MKATIHNPMQLVDVHEYPIPEEDKAAIPSIIQSVSINLTSTHRKRRKKINQGGK